MKTSRISRKSWHYVLRCKMCLDDSRSICSYFWSTVGVLLVVGIFYFIFFVTTLISYFISPFFGYYPQRFGLTVPISGVKDEDWKIYGLTSRKSLFQFKGTSFYGYQFLLSGFLTYFLSILGWWLQIIVFIVMFIAVIFLSWFLYIICNKARRTESWSVIKEYIRAFKNKVCPLIEYVD